jgi:nucleoside-diphosphate-sugar epimerase
MKILVLGSAGQIGSYLVDYLEEKGHDIATFDIVDGAAQDLRLPGGHMLDLSIENADFIFFLAFDVGGSRYLAKYQHTYEFMNNNIRIMAETFDSLRRYNKPFIFASSQMSNMIHSPYGLLKAIGEEYTRILGGKTVKFWNVYGLEHDMEKAHVITDFIVKAKTTGVVDMLTDGEEYREFLYADDCCEALNMVMQNYGNDALPEELCITSFRPVQIKEVGFFIANYLGARLVAGTKKDTVQMDKNNIPNKDILNFWTPKTTIFHGILKVIEEMED